jgi:DNA-binding NarL/FixJ family response regulator
MGIVKQHLRTLFRHAGIKESGKRVKLANLFTNVSGKFVCPLGMAHSFTLKEGMVLEGVAHGNTNKQIGVLLSTSEQVVKNYMREVMNKTGMSTRAEVAAWYFGHCV